MGTLFWTLNWKQCPKQWHSEGRAEGWGQRAGGSEAIALARGGEVRHGLPGCWQTCNEILGNPGLCAPWLLPIPHKDAWRRHLRFVYKQRSQEWCKADSSATVISAEHKCAQKPLYSSSRQAARWLQALPAVEPLPHVGVASGGFPGQPGTKVGPNNQLKASLLSLSRAFTKHNSSKTSDAHV